MRFKHLLTGVAFVLAVSVGLADDKKADKPFDDAEFVKKAASGGMHEVELGKLAAKMGHSDEVKKFGKKMDADHTKANKELMTVAKVANLEVPTKMNEKDQKHFDMFKEMKGDDFDKHYIDHMVKDHEMDIEEFTKASKEAKSPELKSFATKTLPTLKEHYEMIKKMQK